MAPRGRGRRPADLERVRAAGCRILENGAALWAQGQAMTLEQAVAYALEAPAPRPWRPGPPGGLTPREQEVAVLVARGDTNAQIARALVIAPRTAMRHVEHVMAKLGVHSRAQVGAWAGAVGLARGQVEQGEPGSGPRGPPAPSAGRAPGVRLVG